MTLVFDAGALMAVDRGDRSMWVRLAGALAAGEVPRTHPGVLAQVWRDGARQARLARVLPGLSVQVLDEAWGRRCGALLARAGTTDVVDAGVALLAQDGDDILTSDIPDLARLVAATGVHAELVPV